VEGKEKVFVSVVKLVQNISATGKMDKPSLKEILRVLMTALKFERVSETPLRKVESSETSHMGKTCGDVCSY